MSVSPETLVSVLKEFLRFEEFTVENLAEVSHFDFRSFGPHQEKEIRNLLSQLKEDSGEHQKVILKIMERLGYEPKENSPQTRGNSKRI